MDYLTRDGVTGELLERSVRYAIERTRNERKLRRRTCELGERVVVNTRDMTVEERARRRIQFQADLLDAVGQAVIALGLDGTIVDANAAAESEVRPRVVT